MKKFLLILFVAAASFSSYSMASTCDELADEWNECQTPGVDCDMDDFIAILDEMADECT